MIDIILLCGMMLIMLINAEFAEISFAGLVFKISISQLPYIPHCLPSHHIYPARSMSLSTTLTVMTVELNRMLSIIQVRRDASEEFISMRRSYSKKVTRKSFGGNF